MDIELKDIPLDQIEKTQIRDIGSVTDLKENIEKLGLLQPIGVHTLPDARYRLRFGRRRLEAVLQLGWTSIPAIVLNENLEPGNLLLQAIAENVARKQMNVLELAAQIHELVSQYGATVTNTAAACGVSPGTFSQLLSLQKKLCPAAKDALVEERINASQARELIRLPAKQQEDLLPRIAEMPSAALHESVSLLLEHEPRPRKKKRPVTVAVGDSVVTYQPKDADREEEPPPPAASEPPSPVEPGPELVVPEESQQKIRKGKLPELPSVSLPHTKRDTRTRQEILDMVEGLESFYASVRNQPQYKDVSYHVAGRILALLWVLKRDGARIDSKVVLL